MKTFVVFGSASDENVSLPMVDNLKKIGPCEYAVISAHRNLEQLAAKIPTLDVDAIVAGAGLAAALPGVVAAMTTLPVFGVPVASQFAGLDSFGSIAQMPPGVPVLTCGPDKTDAIVKFLSQWKTATPTKGVHFIVPAGANAADDIVKGEKVGAEKGLAVTSSNEASPTAFNVRFVTCAQDVKPEEFCLHVPLLAKGDIAKPEKYLDVLQWATLGGIWVGVNNTRNAVHAASRLANRLGVLHAAA